MAEGSRESRFCRDRSFYTAFFRMMAFLTLQNILTYTVNVADNIMLGAYSQTALAGAAAVNQIQYVLQQVVAAGLGEGLVILAGQYAGRGKARALSRITGTALMGGVAGGALLTAAAWLAPEALVGLFTDVPGIRVEGMRYLAIIKWTYLPFVVSSILLASLRSTKTVSIAFRTSCLTLAVNTGISYVLINGAFGAPRLGITGAAIGTLIARVLEFAAVTAYVVRHRERVMPDAAGLWRPPRALRLDYCRVALPCVASALLFSAATAIQTAIFGHLSADAMAAVSISSTLYQYCKMVPVSAAASACVLVSGLVGAGSREKLRPAVRSLQLIFAGVGVSTGLLLLLIRDPVLELYSVTGTARQYAMDILLVQALVAVGMSYQMPCQLGIIRGGGDTRYSMISDLIYSWAIVVPLGLLAAFVFRWPVGVVSFCLNIDQLLKCITIGIKTNRYTWISEFTKHEIEQ
ncbi:MAG: MATE family efflux transporter [Oscillospiraceae bacterium]|nr:MATE family efflux transporter [Oscillospiraceae bacterium]